MRESSFRDILDVRNSVTRVPIYTHPYTVAAYFPMERIDSMSLLQCIRLQVMSIIICCFTRRVKLFPLCKGLNQCNSSESFATALWQIWQFSPNSPWQCNDELVKQTPIRADSSEENSWVERANKEIIMHLRVIVFDKNIISKWRRLSSYGAKNSQRNSQWSERSWHRPIIIW